MCLGSFGPVLSAAASLKYTGDATRADELEENVSPEDVPSTVSCAESCAAQSKVVGQCETRRQSTAERCLGQHLNPFLHT